jgi:hypothetical protein
MGYFLGVLALLLLAVILLARGRARTSARTAGQLPADHPVARTEPAADEPTPGDSATSPPGRVQRAQERVPPA